MYNKIYINESDTNIKAGDIKFMLDKKCEYWRVYFSMSRIKWALFENNYYDKDIEKFNNKDENNKYTSLQSIPKYYVYKDCIPYDILTANVAEYAGDTTIGGAGTRWRFSTYDVITPINGKL